MALSESEAVQCSVCEEYSRIGELKDVVYQGFKNPRIKIKKKGYEDRGGLIGFCPHCGFDVCQSDVC